MMSISIFRKRAKRSAALLEEKSVSKVEGRENGTIVERGLRTTLPYQVPPSEGEYRDRVVHFELENAKPDASAH